MCFDLEFVCFPRLKINCVSKLLQLMNGLTATQCQCHRATYNVKSLTFYKVFVHCAFGLLKPFVEKAEDSSQLVWCQLHLHDAIEKLMFYDLVSPCFGSRFLSGLCLNF